MIKQSFSRIFFFCQNFIWKTKFIRNTHSVEILEKLLKYFVWSIQTICKLAMWSLMMLMSDWLHAPFAQKFVYAHRNTQDRKIFRFIDYIISGKMSGQEATMASNTYWHIERIHEKNFKTENAVLLIIIVELLQFVLPMAAESS